jgi:hypothetical protein
MPYPASKITYNIHHDSHKTTNQPLAATVPSGCTVHTSRKASLELGFFKNLPKKTQSHSIIFHDKTHSE